MKKKAYGAIRNLNYQFFQYSQKHNEQKNFMNSLDGEKIGSS